MAPRDGKRNQKSKMPHGKSKLRNPLKKAEINFKSPKRELPSILFQDDEPDFPRGGGSVLSWEEEAEVRAEAEAEFEREQGLKSRSREKHKKKKKDVRGKSYKFGEDEWGSLFGQGITGKLPRLTNRITWKNISPGMKLWGVITEVNLKDLVISLPGGLRGFVHAEDASDVLAHNGDEVPFLLPKTLHVGQLVSCVVMQVDDDKGEEKGRKKVRLSLRLSVLYKGLTLDAVQDGMFLETLISLGPFYTKLGQALSTRPYLLPKAYCQELSKLQKTKSIGASLEQVEGEVLESTASESS